MIEQRMQNEMNDQINAELWSAYLYLSMSAWLAKKRFPGFAHWMEVQAREEVAHAMKMFRYLLERDGEVRLQQIKVVPQQWNSAEDVFQHTYNHEKNVTKMIDSLVNTATELKDEESVSFLKWYVDEQVEEETSAYAILDSIKQFVGNSEEFKRYDKGFLSRVFVDNTEA